MTTEINGSNPYPGPRPFVESEEKLFFGRDKEKIELISIITAHRVTILYSQSGAGKTSLLNAFLLPALRRERFDVLPVVRIGAPMPEGTSLGKKENVYVFNSLTQWNATADPQYLINQRLDNFLHWDYLRKYESAKEKRKSQSPRIIIFDQFEELFTTYPDRWEQRSEFFEQLAAALEPEPKRWKEFLKSSGLPDSIEDDRSLRVVFVVREEYLAALHHLADLLPIKPAMRIRLERLRKDAALSAIREPIKAVGRSFAPGVAEELVEKLSKIRVETKDGKTETVEGEFIEPVQLQVVCNKLLKKIPDNAGPITGENIEEIGDVDKALADYYDDAIVTVCAKHPGVKEGLLRNWFEEVLITPAGTRGTVYMDQGLGTTGGIPNDVVQKIQTLHLIRGEQRAGATWYELSHDRFIEPIVQSNKAWRKQHLDETGRFLEERAEDWKASGYPKNKLLNEEELKKAVNWLTSPEADKIGYKQSVTDLVRASREELQARTNTRLRWLAVALALFFVLAAAAAIYARTQEKDARRKGNEVRLKAQQLEEANKALEKARERLKKRKNKLEKKNADNETLIGKLDKNNAELTNIRNDLIAKNAELDAKKTRLENTITELTTTRNELSEKVKQLKLEREQLQIARNKLTSVNEQLIIAQRQTELDSRIASSRELAAASEVSGKTEDDPVPSTYLALYSLSNIFNAQQTDFTKKSTEEVRGGLLYALRQVNPLKKVTIESIQSLQEALPGALIKIKPLINTGPVIDQGFTSDGTKLFTVTEDGTTKVWDTTDGKELSMIEGQNDQISTVAISPNAEVFAAGKRAFNQPIKIRNLLTSDTAATTMHGHKRGIYRLKFSDDGKLLATANNFGNFAVKDVESLKAIKDIWEKPNWFEKIQVRLFNTDIFHNASVFAFNHDPKNRIVAVAFHDSKASLYDVKSGRTLASLPKPEQGGHKDAVVSMAFSPTHPILVTAGRDRTIKVWDISSLRNSKASAQTRVPRLIGELRGHKNPAMSIAFSRDGKLIATGSEDRTAIIWDAERREPLVTLPANKEYVNAVAFSEDGKSLATVSSDKTAKIWDISSISKFIELRDRVESLKASLSFENGVADASRQDINAIMRDVQKLLHRRLTPEECQQYLRKPCPTLP